MDLKYIRYNRFIINPFIIYSFTWLLVLLIYSLHWSLLCPTDLSYYKYFLLLTIFLSFVLGIVFYRHRVFSYKFDKGFKAIKIKKYNIILYLLFLLEVFIAKEIPILGYIRGNVNIKYTEFGLPFVHVIIANGFVLICFCSFYSYLCSSSRKLKKTYLINMFFAIFPYVLMFNRGGLMYCFIGCLLIYLMQCENLKRKIFYSALISLGILFGFGILGNLRTDVKGVSNIIIQFGEATTEFQNSPVPDEFFWPYIYISSPLANAQLMMDKSDREFSINNFNKFIKYEMTPELISKRVLGGNLDEEDMDKILDAFNVASVYGMSAKYMGWLGPVFLYIFWIFFVIVTMGLIPKSSPFYVIGITSVCLITIMNTFDNMFVFMGLIPQPLIIILSCYKFKLYGRNKNINMCSIIQSRH